MKNDKLFITRVNRYCNLAKNLRAGKLPKSPNNMEAYRGLEIQLLNELSESVMSQVTRALNREVIYANEYCKSNSHFLVRPLSEKAFQIGGYTV